MACPPTSEWSLTVLIQHFTLPRRVFFVLVILLGLSMLGFAVATEMVKPQSTALSLRIDGPIGPATSDWVERGFAEARQRNAQLIVLEIDTPGGLDSSMRLIIKQILGSPVPVVGWVGPEGARAASAGTFILYASHVAAMAPATNLGAASPVAIGAAPMPGSSSDKPTDANRDTSDPAGADAPTDSADTPETGLDRPAIRSGNTLMDKAANDAAAYLRSLAQLRERNVSFAEKAVRDAASLSANEALEAGVIELIAISVPELLKAIDGRVVKLDSGEMVTLATANMQLEQLEPDWRAQMLAVLSNPQIALVLMMIGIYGLFFEFTSPGFGVPGVAGLVSLLIALYAFQMLPVNWAGVALIALGAILMLAEAFAPSFGVLGIGGLIAFVVGGLFLFDGSTPGFAVPLAFLITLGVISAVTLAGIGGFAVKARSRRVVSGKEELIGSTGEVTCSSGHTGYAHIHGESWQVCGSRPLVVGERVRVTRLDGLTLSVEPLSPQDDYN